MGIKVKAIDVGYHGVQRYRKGQVFEIESEKEFSENWMQRLDTTSGSRKAKAKAKAIVEDDDEAIDEEPTEENTKPTGDNEVI